MLTDHIRGSARFIPAPAGNTRRSAGPSCAAPVHPRACGEHPRSTKWSAHCSGSSPRLRGTRLAVLERLARFRFIPAPAGNTAVENQCVLHDAVHPRACGEHLRDFREALHHRGSSPRLRGTPRWRSGCKPKRRFIPAPAGNTTTPRPTAAATAVHPRACGEHSKRCLRRTSSAGSSPRLRGTLKMAHGFSPITTVHPRACGEHDFHLSPHLVLHGSSPRLRGTRRPAPIAGRWARFIPAPAGNTAHSILHTRRPPVHPRACGEHQKHLSLRLNSNGSSPRLRGTHGVEQAEDDIARFIPAPAGNTSVRNTRPP